jgi:hypothetical protein
MYKPYFFFLSILLAASLACDLSTPQTSSGSNSNLLFQDDFSSTSSGWDKVHDADGITDYENGAYRIQINTIGTNGNGMSYWATPGLESQIPADVHIEVDATKNGGPDENDFGVMCRYTTANKKPNFYQFMVTSDGYVGILLVTNGDQKMISSDKLQASDAVKQDGTLNHIRADCVGTSLTLYVNSQKVATATDASLTNGDVGLIAGTYKQPGTDIFFDNYIVTKP